VDVFSLKNWIFREGGNLPKKWIFVKTFSEETDIFFEKLDVSPLQPT